MLFTCGSLGLDPAKLSLADYAAVVFHHNVANEGENKELPPPDWDWFNDLPDTL